MCGICGIIRFDDSPVERAALEASCTRMKHRGPDHTGIWIEKSDGASVETSVGLGAVRLAVLDPSLSANQPMHRSDGRFHLVFNGEIYNHNELRRELESLGETCYTKGDTEVVLLACVKWGVAALTKFNGMWSLAFYDSQERTGFLARDRYGIKPTFYSSQNHVLAFASELQSLVALTGIDRSINQRAVLEHLSYGYIAHPATIYNAAHRLSPGHYLPFCSTSTSSGKNVGEPTRYYDPLVEKRAIDNPQSPDTRAELRRLIGNAVTCRSVAHVPVGAFLSGGLDSSIIVLHMAQASGKPIKTFSLGYADRSSYDESAYARLMSDHCYTDHHELMLTQHDVLAALPEVLDHLGEPVGDSSIVPTAMVSEFARRDVTVSLSGDAGDELFGGYWRYLGHSSLALYHRLPAWLRNWFLESMVARLSKGRSSTLSNRARQFQKLIRPSEPTGLGRHLSWSRILSPHAYDLLADPQALQALESDVLKKAKRCTAAMPTDDLNRILAFDLQHQLPADMLQKVDLSSMMHSLEVRVPLLDPSVVSFALGLPASVKIDRGLRKKILVDAYRGHLPDEVLDRPKQGFEVPIGEYFRGPLIEMFRDVVTCKTLQAFPVISDQAVERVLSEHIARQADHADLLFALLSLCWWHRKQAI